jgi:hypothetical protein
LRIQTLGGLYGIKVEMPDRYGEKSGLKESTETRIAESELTIFFAGKKMSKQMRKEIDFAIEKEKWVLIFYKESPSQYIARKMMAEIVLKNDKGNSFDIDFGVTRGISTQAYNIAALAFVLYTMSLKDQ